MRNTPLEKNLVRSFDIFDTLIARTVAEPTDVFDIVEQGGIANFKRLRIQAQSLSNHTWADIYAHYQRLANVDESEVRRVQQLELQAEMSVSYMISDTYHKIRNGDILVSDMYLTGDALAAILKAVGFDKQIEIFVSPAGKASGKIWPELKKNFDIEHHLGDNLTSDVHSPAQHDIAASHFCGAQPSPLETLYAERGAVVSAGLLKRFRLTNPFAQETREWRLHDTQAMCNLPFLLLMAFHLRGIMEREGLSRLLFTTRDSCLLQPLYDILFPEAESISFYSSRVALTERRQSYVQYVRNTYILGTTLIFDLHGAFKSGRELFKDVFGALPRVHIFSGAAGRAPDDPGISFDVKQGSNHVELLNLDMVGSLVTVDDRGRPVRMPADGAAAQVGALYRTIASRFNEFVRSHLDVVRRELSPLVRDIPWNMVHDYIRDTVSQVPDLPVTELTEHQSLTEIMNELGCDKGSTYACAHCYTFVYEALFQELVLRDQISMLEIGLNRDGYDEIPSLRGWKKYFGPKVTLYGMDIDPRFLRHHDVAAGINILIGDQSSSADLVRCGIANPSGYDIIIDDGSHMSRHQQVSLRTLWRNLRPGGIYVVEDLHYQPTVEDVMDTRELIRLWKDGIPAFTYHISRADAALIIGEAASIELYDSLSLLWGDKTHHALAVIKKQA